MNIPLQEGSLFEQSGGQVAEGMFASFGSFNFKCFWSAENASKLQNGTSNLEFVTSKLSFCMLQNILGYLAFIVSICGTQSHYISN